MAIQITYYVHSTTTDNEKGLATGWRQGELSSIGITRSRGIYVTLLEKNFDAVFTSDLKRAIDTTKLFFKDRFPIVQDPRLRECNYGDYTGRREKEFKQDLDKYITIPFPHGESYMMVQKRMVEFLKSLKPKYDGKHIAIVSHQAPQLALDVLLKRRTWDQAIAEDWRNTRAWQLGWEYTMP